MGLFDTSFGAIWLYTTQNLVFKMTMLEAFVITQVSQMRKMIFLPHIKNVSLCSDQC